jgi:hypothetical protein
MKKIFKLFITTSALLTLSTPVDVHAKQQHKIGFVKIAISELRQTGTCGYWIKGSKNENNLILVRGVTNNPLMNIDGKNISLSLINSKEEKRRGKIFYINKYKSSIFQIKTVLTDATTAKDRKNYATRESGDITVQSDNGWQKKVSVECAYDSGG